MGKYNSIFFITPSKSSNTGWRLSASNFFIIGSESFLGDSSLFRIHQPQTYQDHR